ncbi:MAG: hypothetical protein ACRCTZ_02210 [Sarcina sp.]
MRKLLVLSLCALLTGSVLVGCGEKKVEKESVLEKNEQVNLEKESVEEKSEAVAIKIEDIDLKGLTEKNFKAFENLNEITTAAEEHNNRLVAGNEVIKDTFDNTSTGAYKKGAINSEKNFVVDFTNKDKESSLKTIATEFAVSTTDKNCVSRTVMHFTAKKDKGLILTDDEVKVIKTLIPELNQEDIKKCINDLVKKSLDEPKENGYNHDFKVEEPKALFLETEPANEEAEDLVIKLVYWSNYNYI